MWWKCRVASPELYITLTSVRALVLARVIHIEEHVSMSQKQLKAPPEHRDKLGRVIHIDSYVAYPSHNSLAFGRVIKLNNKMIKVVKVPAGKYKDSGSNKYPHDLVLLEDRDMTWYLLKNSG
jgi:hypothetical protein